MLGLFQMLGRGDFVVASCPSSRYSLIFHSSSSSPSSLSDDDTPALYPHRSSTLRISLSVATTPHSNSSIVYCVVCNTNVTTLLFSSCPAPAHLSVYPPLSFLRACARCCCSTCSHVTAGRCPCPCLLPCRSSRASSKHHPLGTLLL